MLQARPSTDTAQRGSVLKTILGGILFLLPIVVIVILIGKALGFARRLSEPLVQAAGVNSVAGVAMGTIVSIAFLVIVAFAAGLLARTRLGQSAFSKLEDSVLSLIPQW